MSNPRITTSFVSQVSRLPFADALEAADGLAGREVTAGNVKLSIGDRIGDGLAGAVWYSGVLRTGSPILPSVRVDLVLTPWSAGRVEVGIRPLGRLGVAQSLRATRFFNAAWSVMPALVSALSTTVVPVPVPVPARAAA
jgi:hypothetical protein